MNKKLFLGFIVIFSLFYPSNIFSQNEEMEEEDELPVKTFYGTRIINGHSVETLSKGYMEMRIEHRFGDIAGINGGYQNMFGFDNLSDMRIALEYGINDDFMLGFGRCKGAGTPFRSLLDGFVKYRSVRQSKNNPISLTVLAGGSFTYMKASSEQYQVSHFPKAVHRISYFAQMNLARKFGDWLSLSLMPTMVHRNYVAFNDQNDVFSLGAATRIKLSAQYALIGEYFHTFNSSGYRPAEEYKNSFGIALEWQTFGHNFTVNVTNSGGLGETQFIPYSFENIMKGQFRFGFCVARKFVMKD